MKITLLLDSELTNEKIDCLLSMSGGSVNRSFLGAHNKIVNIPRTETHGCDCHMPRLLALQLQGLLWCVHVIQSPWTQFAVIAYAYKVVGVLRANHLNAMDWMLNNLSIIVKSPSQSKVFRKKPNKFTVCDAAESEERWIGVLLLLRLSHMTIWPE